MEAVVINGILSNKQTVELSAKMNNSTGSELFANVKLPPELTKFNKGNIEIQAKEKKEINYNIFKEILNFGEKPINNTPVTDLLTIGKASIWHYNKFRIYFTIRNLYYEKQLLDKLAGTYEKVSYYTGNTLLASCNPGHSNVTIHLCKPGKEKLNILSLFNYLVFFLLRSLISITALKRLSKADYMLLDHSFKQTCLNINTLKPEKGNYNLQYLFDKVNDKFLIVEDTEIPKPKGNITFRFSLSSLTLKRKRFYGELILLRGLLSGKVIKQTKNNHKHITYKLKEISNSLDSLPEKLIVKQLQALNKTNKIFIFKYFAYNHFFEKHNFKSVISIDENSPRIKSILDAAKQSNIKAIGIQHGTIHELHPAYMFTKNDRNRKIMPDYTMVWGEHWKNLLIEKGNYPENSLIITGQIRTDIIPKLNRQKPEIPDLNKGNKKIVLYASQFQRDQRLRINAAYDIFNSIKNLPDTMLIIKLHPSERNEFDFYHNIAKETGCKNYQIHYWTDLYLLLSRSDIVVTCFSTVGTEAIYFKKPLIIIDPLKEDIQGYIKLNVGILATNQDELQNSIKQVITKKITIDNNTYTNFINNYTYKIDGKVCRRIISSIENLK